MFLHVSCQGIILWKEAIDIRQNELKFSFFVMLFFCPNVISFQRTQKFLELAESRSWNALKKQALTKTSQMELYTRTFTRKYMVKVKTEHVVT